MYKKHIHATTATIIRVLGTYPVHLMHCVVHKSEQRNTDSLYYTVDINNVCSGGWVLGTSHGLTIGVRINRIPRNSL